MSQAYLDYNASAPSPFELENELTTLIKKNFANPSSLHANGRQARSLINQATCSFAEFVDCEPEFVYWTSGASESNSWALHSAIESAKRNGKKPRLLLSAIEHESNLVAAKWYGQEHGVTVCLVPVDSSGVVSISFLENLFKTDAQWSLLCVMIANNETGVIQPVEAIVALAKKYGIPTHVDCVQALGKMDFSVKKLSATYTTFSAHKIGGLKGAGALVVTGSGQILSPLIHGKQQKSLRAGTENPVGVGFFGILLKKMKSHPFANLMANLMTMRNDFESELKRTIPGTIIHGEKVLRLPNTSCVGFELTDGDSILMNLDLEGISASSGSACTSGSVDPSHVLLAMGCDKNISRASVRFSTGWGSQWRDYEAVLKVLPDIIGRIRKVATK